MLSDTAEYALRAVLYIADNADRQPVSVDAAARALTVPRNYLSKTLNQLVKRGILHSQRGPHGGFWLAVDPAALPLLRIVEVFDEIGPGRKCLLGRPQCSDATPCPAHVRWKEVGERIAVFFRGTTVEDLLRTPPAERRLSPSAE